MKKPKIEISEIYENNFFKKTHLYMCKLNKYIPDVEHKK
jgi:hypothetical protein